MYDDMGDLSARIPDWGVDARPEDRPGVPMEHEPRPMDGVHWREPYRQESNVPHLERVGQERLTPVYGTTLPPKGLSGMIRRFAYSIPEHRARHWMALLVADRVDVVEYALGKRSRWLPVIAAAGGGAWALRRAFRRKAGRPYVTRRRRAQPPPTGAWPVEPYGRAGYRDRGPSVPAIH